MNRVLLLATTTGYQTRTFVEAARRLHVQLVFATDRCDTLDDPWRDGAIPIRFHDVRRSVEAICDEARARPIDGVVAVGDRPAVVAAMAARALGLPWHPPEAAKIAGNKLLTRQRLRAAGLLVPWFQATSVRADPRELSRIVPYPCVVKPLALSGSRGVIRADDEPAFVEAFTRLRTLLASADVRRERKAALEHVLVEGFVEGREFALEGLVDRGSFHALALFDKPDPLDGPFFEETIYVTPSLAPRGVQGEIVEAVTRAARAIGLTHGPIHAECRAGSAGSYVLEVAARPIGGLCARALRFRSAGSTEPPPDAGAQTDEDAVAVESLEGVLLRHALGEPADAWRRESPASGVMMIPIPRRGVYRHVSGVDAASRVRGITDVRVTAKPDQLLLPLPEGASYLGFIFARGPEPGQVEAALREANGLLRFTIDPELPMVQSRHG